MCLSTAVNAVVAWMLHKKTSVPGPGWWTVGSACVSFGLLLISFRGILGGFLDIAVANGLILTGYAIVWDGMRRFSGRQFSRLALCLSCLVVVCVFWGNLWFSAFAASLSARVVINSLGILFFSVAIGNTLLAAKFDNRAVTLTGAGYSLNGILNGLRLVGPVVGPGAASFMGGGSFTIFFLSMSLIFSIGVIFGQVLMVREEIGGTDGEDVSIGKLLFS